MAVILPNVDLAVRAHAHPFARDAYDQPVTPDTDPALSVFAPGSAIVRGRNAEGVEEWSLRLDPSFWPVHPGDRVTDGTRVWVLMGNPDPKLHVLAVPGVGSSPVDYVSAFGVLEPPPDVP